MTSAKFWTIGLVAAALGAGGAAMYLRNKGQREPAAEVATEQVKGGPQVKVIHPRKNALERLCIQPGSVHSFESIELFAEVPGFLRTLTVDIEDRVEKGQLLAEVGVPDISALVERNKAGVEKADSQLVQMKARVEVAKANFDAAQAAVTQAEATAKASLAWVKYRFLQLGRMESLVKQTAIEDRLYDESKERHDASVESEIAARAAIVTTKANVKAKKALIDQAEADVVEAEAEIRVAKAELKTAQVKLNFATIRAPFDGVVAYRSMNPGDFVRAGNSGANISPLLTVRRTDLFRVIVLVPDRDVRFLRKGIPATVEIDALPGMKWTTKVSRMAKSLDTQTRLMRVELDLPNPTGEIEHGMYGQVTIVLEKGADLLSIPSPCISSKGENGKATVYVVNKAGRAEKKQVVLGMDSGLRVAVLKGLSKDDQVILNPSSDLSENPAVTAALWDDAAVTLKEGRDGPSQ